ncbi:DUF6392 family protein [Photorhabdus sp. SF281]|uniref:DUF6392 family protein n=1 Tax=Photorhabdus sp. SF281 TaxID=3459527 RepID=UPI004044A794
MCTKKDIEPLLFDLRNVDYKPVNYEYLVKNGQLSRDIEPSSLSDDDYVSYHLVDEGIYLAFRQEDMAFFHMALFIIDDDNTLHSFECSSGDIIFKPGMSRKDMHEEYGQPKKSIPPKIIMNEYYGWMDCYDISQTEMKFRYDSSEKLKTVSFTRLVYDKYSGKTEWSMFV